MEREGRAVVPDQAPCGTGWLRQIIERFWQAAYEGWDRSGWRGREQLKVS
jgi:hypothetical protein